MDRVVLDSTVLVSAFFTPNGVSAEIIRRAGAGAFRLCLSLPILVEVDRVLRTTKRRQRQPYTDAEIVRYLRLLGMVADLIPDPPPLTGVVRDPNDDMVVACAIGAGAACVVSRDKDLLSLGQYGAVAMLAPEDFMQLLRAQG